jgi:hypothetical protein
MDNKISKSYWHLFEDSAHKKKGGFIVARKKVSAYQRTPLKQSYLKYLRITRYYIGKKYDINFTTMEVLFYLAEFDLFTRKEYLDYIQIFSWQKTRFKRLLDDGWIQIYKIKQRNKGDRRMYTVSIKTRSMINHMVSVLNGEEDIPEMAASNPLFRRRLTYVEKVYRNAIKNIMNKDEDRRNDRPSNTNWE